MSSFPLPDIHYRIQSAETGAFLELRDIDLKATAMRFLKDDSCLEQQWIFVEDDDHTHLVLNAAAAGLRHPHYLSVDSNTKRIVALAEDLDDNDDDDDDDDDDDNENLNDVKSWLINQEDREGLYTSDNHA